MRHKMGDIGVLFLVEHVDRELDIVTCLMQRLESGFGIRTEARSYYQDFEHNLALFNPKVVVFPFFYGADHLQPIQYSTRWPRACLINLGWEQILNKLDVGMKIPRDVVARSRVIHICWTLQHRDFLASNGVVPENLQVTGNPVMKLYDDPYKKYFKSREQLAELYKLDYKKKWVLFPESYQFAFFSAEHLDRLVIYQNADKELLTQAQEYCKQSLKRLLMWVNELTEDDALFILRPRPSTSREQMANFIHQTVRYQSANVKIIKTETAREWILASDHVISSHSTTLIEAAFAGKPIHRFSPGPYPEAIRAEWHSLIPLLTDRKALLHAIRHAPTQPMGTLLADWARDWFLPAGDPLISIAERIAVLHGVAPESEACDYRDTWDDECITPNEDIFDKDLFKGGDVHSRLLRWQSVLNTCS